jgi:hypothetical protein
MTIEEVAGHIRVYARTQLAYLETGHHLWFRSMMLQNASAA